MNRAFVFGMLTVMSLSLSPAMAAPGAAVRPVREMHTEYTRTIRDYFKNIGANKSITARNRPVIERMIEEDLNLSGRNKGNLMAALTGAPKDVLPQRVDALSSIIAAKRSAVEISKVDAVEGASLEAAAVAAAKLLANANLFGALPSKTLNATELVLVKDALAKLETLPSDILLKFSRAERDSFVEVLERFDVLAETGTRGSAEESFVRAIMEVKKIDRDKALEVTRRLKECV